MKHFLSLLLISSIIVTPLALDAAERGEAEEPAIPEPDTTVVVGDAETVPSAALIVTFEAELARAVRESLRARGPELPSELAALNATLGVHTIEPVIARGELATRRSSTLAERFPARAARAPGANDGGADDGGADDGGAADRLGRTFRLALAEPRDIVAAAATYAATDGVERAEAETAVEATFSDPFYNPVDQWPMFTIDAEVAWDEGLTGDGVVVAVIDTGVHGTHPDLIDLRWQNPGEVANGLDDDGNGRVDDLYGWDCIADDNDPYDAHGHGTHVAGTIAAEVDNGLGTIGVAPRARIMPVKALGDSGSGTQASVVCAITYAVDTGADVINLSLGGGGRSQAIEDAVSYATSHGVVVVAAAGNDQADVCTKHPANVERAIAVAATDRNDVLSPFSNRGVKIDVAAPGGDGSNSVLEDVLATAPPTSVLDNNPNIPGTSSGGGRYLWLAGTSMAAPHVSALAAILIERSPGWSIEEIRQAIRQHATDVDDPGFDPRTGHGRIDVGATVLSGLSALPTAQLLEPYNCATVRHEVNLTGDAWAAGAGATYRIEAGSGDTPTAFDPLISGAATIQDAALGTIDSRLLPDGAVTLRVVTEDPITGAVSEDRNLIEVDNVYIAHPVDGQILSGAEVDITGQVAGWHRSLYWTLDYAPGWDATTGWVNIFEGSQLIDPEALLEVWAFGTLADGPYTLRLAADFGTHVSEDHKNIVLDRSQLAGWPVKVAHLPTRKSPQIVDLDGDGRNEVVYGASVFDRHGALKPGWTNVPGSGRTNAVVLDVDGDPELEVVTVYIEGDLTTTDWTEPVVYAFDPDKSVVWQHPVTDPLNSGYSNHGTASSVSAGDVDGDGTMEIIFMMFFQQYNPGFESRVFVLDAATGDLEHTFAAGGMAFNTVSLADIDPARPGEELIIAATEVLAGSGRVTVVEPDGTPIAGWPVAADPGIGNIDPIIADVDVDGRYEILAGRFLWNHDGTPVTVGPNAWPDPLSLGSTGVVAPLPDNDGQLEVIIRRALWAFDVRDDDRSVQYRLGRHYGEDKGGIGLNENSGAGNPLVADIDGDGLVELVAPSRHGHWDPALPVPIYAAEAPVQGPWANVPTGFPRFVPTSTGTFADVVYGTPALGDLDGDGVLDMVAAGRGVLHAWSLGVPVPATPNPWPMFQHDLLNTGRFDLEVE